MSRLVRRLSATLFVLALASCAAASGYDPKRYAKSDSGAPDPDTAPLPAQPKTTISDPKQPPLPPPPPPPPPKVEEEAGPPAAARKSDAGKPKK